MRSLRQWIPKWKRNVMKWKRWNTCKPMNCSYSYINFNTFLVLLTTLHHIHVFLFIAYTSFLSHTHTHILGSFGIQYIDSLSCNPEKLRIESLTSCLADDLLHLWSHSHQKQENNNPVITKPRLAWTLIYAYIFCCSFRLTYITHTHTHFSHTGKATDL